MADVPRAREILKEALEFEMQDEARTLINEALELMYRDYSLGRKAPTQSAPVTSEIRSLVRVYARTYPDMTQQQIATEFNLNAGRVSEILTGKR
jgi:hypothetical protein